MEAVEKNFRERARLVPKGSHYEDFDIGRVYKHHWGRTINAGDNSLFTTLTLSYNPIYFNVEHARRMGHPSTVVNPLLVFNTVFGLTVEDLSEGGGPFLGVDKLTYHHDVYEGDTLTAKSTVISKRTTDKKPGFGIVTWHTQGFDQSGRCVVDFMRTNLVRRRP